MFIPGYYYQPDGYTDLVQSSDDQCYSTGLFRELQLPSGNTRVHLLRINPLGAEDKETRSSSPPEQRYNGMEARNISDKSSVSDQRNVIVAEEKKPKKKTQKFEMPKIDLMLPCDNVSTSSDGSLNYAGKKSKATIMMLDGREGDLETERVSFQDQPPAFSNSVDNGFSKSDHAAEIATLVEQFPSFKNRRGFKHIVGANDKTQHSRSSEADAQVPTWNGDTSMSSVTKPSQAAKKDKDKNKERRTGRSVVSDEEGPDLQSHVLSLESQIFSQVRVPMVLYVSSV